MNWEVEYENGEPIRMLWRGAEAETFEEVLAMELSRCKGCGFPGGWHRKACQYVGNSPTQETK